MIFPSVDTLEQALSLIEDTDLDELCRVADSLCREIHGSRFDLCSIINARSGKCSEDCKYCAQSSKYNTDIIRYEKIDEALALSQACENDDYGIKRLSLVTAGHSLKIEQLDSLGEMYKAMAASTELKFCASMGFLSPETAQLLYSYGVRRYHCNLEACREFFPSICTTHSWDDKVATLKIARDAGMDLCSGGIIGMGESVEQRLQLAFELRDMEVLSIPINILSPIASTPLENVTPIELDDVLRCVAMFRLINPKAVIRIAGGRGRFAENQYKLFSAGANGAIVGDYLTTMGGGVKEDLQAFSKLGFQFS
jgi:biotin synthase